MIICQRLGERGRRWESELVLMGCIINMEMVVALIFIMNGLFAANCGSLSIVGVKKKVENKRQRKNHLPLNNLRSMIKIKNTITKPFKVFNTKANTL